MRCRWIGAQDLHDFDAAEAGQVDVQQNHLRLIAARKFNAEIAIRSAEQVQVDSARKKLFYQFQVGRIVFHIQQGALRRVLQSLRR